MYNNNRFMAMIKQVNQC